MKFDGGPPSTMPIARPLVTPVVSGGHGVYLLSHGHSSRYSHGALCAFYLKAIENTFITKRFDRIGNDKVHVQTLNGLAHVDYKKPGSFSYEELFSVGRELRLSRDEAGTIVAADVL